MPPGGMTSDISAIAEEGEVEREGSSHPTCFGLLTGGILNESNLSTLASVVE
jgi:hypothetical protein